MRQEGMAGSPNNAMHVDSATTLSFHVVDHWRGASDGERCVTTGSTGV